MKTFCKVCGKELREKAFTPAIIDSNLCPQHFTEAIKLLAKQKRNRKLSNEFAGYSVSHATLRPQDLIMADIQFLNSVSESGAVYGIKDKVKHLSKEFKAIYDAERDEITDDDDAQWILESLESILVDISPMGTSFGAHEGNGSDFGFWYYEQTFDVMLTWLDEEQTIAKVQWETDDVNQTGGEFNVDTSPVPSESRYDFLNETITKIIAQGFHTLPEYVNIRLCEEK